MSPLTGKLILVVDSREDFLHKVVNALKQSAGNPRVVGVATGEKALQILPLQPIKLIVTAYELNDMLSKELIERARERGPRMPFVVYVNPSDRRRHEIALWDNVLTAEYEVQCHEIIEQAISATSLSTQETKTQIADLSLSSAIERLTKERGTARLRVVSSDGLGVIEMEDGELVHAHTRTSQGEGALKKILSWADPSLELVHIMKVDQRTVFSSWQAVKEEIEQGKKAPSIPKPRPKPVVEKPKPPEPKPRKEKKRKEKPHKTKTPKPGKEKKRKIPTPPRTHRKLRRRWIALLILLLILGLAGTGIVFFLREPEIAKAVEEQLRELLKDITKKEATPEPRKTPKVDLAAKQMSARFPAEFQSSPWKICNARSIWLNSFSEAGNTVAVSQELFDALGLKEPGWAEIASSRGLRFGARVAVQETAVGEKVYLRVSMARALGLDPAYPFPVAVRPISWPARGTFEEGISFSTVRTLPVQYTETWYAAGVSLQLMMSRGLLPGTHVIVEGPGGFQSAKIQLMDRGNVEELWLSKSVRDAVGADSPRDTVKLFPRLAQPTQD